MRAVHTKCRYEYSSDGLPLCRNFYTANNTVILFSVSVIRTRYHILAKQKTVPNLPGIPFSGSSQNQLG